MDDGFARNRRKDKKAKSLAFHGPFSWILSAPAVLEALIMRNVLRLREGKDSSGGDSLGGDSLPLPVFFRPLEDNSPLRRYKMDADPRGYCLVIDNHEFIHQNGTVSTRTGSKQDRASLKKSFERLGFFVLIVEDLEDRDLKKWMKTFSQQDHTRFDCFVCCILSHGCESGVSGVNDGLVNINEIISYFSAQMCPSLAGKPKLFFISACRGGTEMPGVRSAHTDSINLQPQPQQAIYIPNEADFFLGFSTVNNYVSYRDEIRGTYYIDELTKVLDRFGHREEIHELLTRVNDAVSRRICSGENGEVYMQMPAPQNTLRKKLYFPPLDENNTQSSRSVH